MEEIQGYPCPHCGFDPRSVKGIEYALPMGTILAGKYLVGRVLGQGGFGITYVGWDIALERKVAIKEYYPSGQVSRNPGSRGLTWYTSVQSQQAKQNGTQMFLKEARKMSKVDDIPNVVRVRDLFQENETAYIVMDFVEGETLKARLEKTGPLPWEQAKDIFLPAIQAMEQVHKAGLVHRDISPDNLMLTPDGKVKILDLGAAKDLSVNNGASSMQVAKGGFSPFEQYTQRGSSGPWTDVYAMAATVYYTLTGKLPPVATDRVVEDTISWEEPGLRALSPQALEALQKAMVISAKTRMQSMEELEKGLYSTAVEPAPTPAPQPVQETQPEPQPAPETKPESQPEQEVKPEPQPTPEPAPQVKAEPKPEAGKKSGKKLWIAAAAVIAVVLCCALIWANAAKPVNDDKQAQVSTNETKYSEPTSAPGCETLGHSWQAATCYAPKTCTRCGETEGDALGHDWPTMEELSYCSRCNEPNGSLELLDPSSYKTILTNQDVKFTLDNGKRVTCTIWDPALKIEKCYSLTLCLRINEYSYGNIEGEWGFYIRDLDGAWHLADTFILSGDYVEAHFEFDEPISFDAWACPCHVLGNNWNFSYSSWLQDITVFTCTDTSAAAPTAAPTAETPSPILSPATSQSLAEEYGRKKVVAAGDHFAVGIKPDGSCIAAGNPKPNVSSWTGMYSLSACGDTAAGLRSDGTVVCSDPTLNVRNWKDIAQIDYYEELWGEDRHIVGLTSSGKVVAEGTNRYGECGVSAWEDIVDVAAGATHTVGLRSDGTVVACGNNEYGQCNVSDWVGIVDVAAARYAVYGLTSDGRILVAGQKYDGDLNRVLEVPRIRLCRRRFNRVRRRRQN